MGIKSEITTDRLYWLGRYTERTYSTIKYYAKNFDKLIEKDVIDYAYVCEALDIPNIYSDKDDFIGRYAFSLEDPNSIISNLTRAYDNAIELREEIGSETLSFIQLAMYSVQKAGLSQSPLMELRKAEDDILAFWGIVDDQIDDEETRNIIKLGKRIERLDLYARMHQSREMLEREVNRLRSRISHCHIEYSRDKVDEVAALAKAEELDYKQIVSAVESITEV